MTLTFLNPAAFLALVLVPLLYALRRAGLLSRVAFPLTLSDWGGRSWSWDGRLHRFLSALASLLSALSFAALVGALAEPVVRRKERLYTSRGTEILFVLDTSISMAARDMTFMNSPVSRLDAARRGIRTLVEAEDGATFALVAVASEAALVVPPTSDRAVFLERMDSLRVGELGDGSALGTGISSGVYHLASTAAASTGAASTAAAPTGGRPRRAVVLLTDGENNAGMVSPETAARLAADNGISLYVLGIGTDGTVPLEYVEPATGKVRSVLYESSFDPEPLREIARAASGRYFGVDSLGELSAALSDIAGRERTVQSFVDRTVDEECYADFLLAAAVLFLSSAFVRRVLLAESC